MNGIYKPGAGNPSENTEVLNAWLYFLLLDYLPWPIVVTWLLQISYLNSELCPSWTDKEETKDIHSLIYNFYDEKTALGIDNASELKGRLQYKVNIITREYNAYWRLT